MSRKARTTGEFMGWIKGLLTGGAAPRKASIRTIKAAQIMRLSAEDQRAFAEAILNPPEPAPALRRAFRRHRELIKERGAAN